MVLEGEHDADYITWRSVGVNQKHQDRSSEPQSSLQVTLWEHVNRCVISSNVCVPTVLPTKEERCGFGG